MKDRCFFIGFDRVFKAASKGKNRRGKRKKKSQLQAEQANAFEEDRKMALSKGMNGHIAKLIDVKNMEEVFDVGFTIVKKKRDINKRDRSQENISDQSLLLFCDTNFINSQIQPIQQPQFRQYLEYTS